MDNARFVLQNQFPLRSSSRKSPETNIIFWQILLSLCYGLKNNLKWLQPLINIFVCDPTYTCFSATVVPNHEMVIQQETHVSYDETETSLHKSPSNTLNVVFINKKALLYNYKLVWNDQVNITAWNFTLLYKILAWNDQVNISAWNFTLL